MGRKLLLAAAVATLAIIGAACAPPPQLNPALVVTTTADTFDGVCDADCSLRDAIAVHNTRAPDPTGAPNRITLPAGTYALSGASPLVVTRALVIAGAGRTTTTLDLTNSPITAPGAAIDARAAVAINGVSIISDAATPTHVLATCSDVVWAVTLLNSSVSGLDAAISTCDAVFVSTFVDGERAVIAPRSISSSASTLPFDGTPLSLLNFSFVSSFLTGPTNPDGSTQDGLLNIQPRSEGLTVSGAITGTRATRVGLQLGGTVPGSVIATVLNSSLGLDGTSGPLGIDVADGSTLRLNNSTVHGGGTAGALRGEGTMEIRAATIASGQQAIAAGAGSNVTVRRSILSSLGATTCTGPVTQQGRNIVVGDSCGTPTATDLSVASQAALLLGPLDRHGGSTPSLAYLPAADSPVIDAIPPGGALDLDCPVDAGQGRSLDQRGVLRPVGAGCDIGSVERKAIEVEV